jgi:hypothetical protein
MKQFLYDYFLVECNFQQDGLIWQWNKVWKVDTQCFVSPIVGKLDCIVVNEFLVVGLYF